MLVTTKCDWLPKFASLKPSTIISEPLETENTFHAFYEYSWLMKKDVSNKTESRYVVPVRWGSLVPS